MKQTLIFFFLLAQTGLFAQAPLITNIAARQTISLNGKWQYIMDPYETGFYDYRYKERAVADPDGYWNSDVPANKTDRKEYGFSDKYTLNVPGDWNSQAEKFLYYEGTVWYKKSFDFTAPGGGKKVYLHFGASNYKTDVYLNQKKLGTHKGGFTPFNFEIPDTLLRAKGNLLVVKVDNKRAADEIPTMNTDWWNYGGLTRDVQLVVVPATFVQDYSIQLRKSSLTAGRKVIEGWVKLNAPSSESLTVQVPGLNQKTTLAFSGADSAAFSFTLPASGPLQLWSPKTPTLYDVVIAGAAETIRDKVGFRIIEVKGPQLLLNGKPLFLRGICQHEEIASEGRRAYSKVDAIKIFKQVKELNANMVRLAHYPHNENMTRTADSMGLLIWSEIPVYWTIDFGNAAVLAKAKVQLHEMMTRDRNRASIIIWSVGNETPVHAARTAFMTELVRTAKGWDSSRLVSAALENHFENGVSTINDPLGAYTDIVSANEYIGWYGGLPPAARASKWEIKYNKPLFFSETGAEALGGFIADSLTRWSEDYQEWFYREQIAMMKRMPANYCGLSPWILNDFRSPRRANPTYQEGWNNKGLYDHQGRKKKAFYVLQKYYNEMEKAYPM